MAWNDIANAYWTFLTWCCGNNAYNVHAVIVFICVIIILHAAIALGSKLRYLFHWKKSADYRDPRRTFTNAEKERMMAHCGHRCENVGGMDAAATPLALQVTTGSLMRVEEKRVRKISSSSVKSVTPENLQNFPPGGKHSSSHNLANDTD